MEKLARSEWYRLVHEKSYWALLVFVLLAYLLVLTGGHQLESSGRDVLGSIMGGRVAAAIMIANVFTALFLGKDFEGHTFSLPIQAGASRLRILLAKSTVSLVSFSTLILIFPILALIWCTAVNGWGVAFSIDEVLSLLALLIALFMLIAAIGALSILTACCFRSAGATVAIPVALMLIQLSLLNSAANLDAAHFLPFCATWYVAKGTIDPLYGIGLGLVWCVALLALSASILHRAELK